MALCSGIGTYIRKIVSLLKSEPFKLQLVTSREVVEKWPDLKHFDLILTSAPVYSIQEQVAFPRIVPQCDLFWTPHYSTPFFSLRAKKRLVTIHDVYHLAFGKTLRLHQQFYAKVMMRRAVNISDHILTISQFSKEEIIKYTKAPQEKISVIHLGVDRSQFTSEPNAILQSEIRKKYGLPQNYFIFVSNLSPHKNIQRLLSAWNLLMKEFPDWGLVLVGKKGKAVFDQNLLNKRGVFLLGQVCDQDLSVLYQLAYAAIHPSLYEGFGLTPLEALSSGCPVVVSKAASLPEVCGDAALYIDPYDIQDIVAGMRRMIQDRILYSQLKERGLERSRNFTWEKTVSEHVKILNQLASTTPP
jgi:glycosyltransferase involved in cell wall biosynthesis